VLLTGREPDHIPGPNLLDRSAFTLSPAASSRDNEGLTEGMGMPCSPRTWLEGDAGALNQRGIGCLEKRIDPNGSGEPICRPLSGRLRADSFDLHASELLALNL